jgi:transcriptional regulator with XRE-family HTH domain
VTPADHARALHAAEPTLTRQQIADRLGLSLSQVQRALRGEPRVPGGGRKPGPHTVSVTVRLTDEEIALVDAARGKRSRTRWVRTAAVIQALIETREAP